VAFRKGNTELSENPTIQKIQIEQQYLLRCFLYLKLKRMITVC